ncbi:MAG TPA: hypothetical protein VH206_14135 [Xanthobacteraceae bacterium]|jgi:hypothetical protein|nr:hypothetical protein [Xanthobacteraceae bacterium]
MRAVHATLLLAVTATPALAQREPQIVIPGKAGVPVYINGIDASWGVVEGEFGLDRPGLVTPTVIYRPLVVSAPQPEPPAYRPKDGRRPGYGRLEIIPPANRQLPPPAPTYYRNWSAGAPPDPVVAQPSVGPIGVEVSPYFGRRRRPHNNNNSPAPKP